MDMIKIVLALLLTAGFIMGGVWLVVYKYHDCKKVGHSTFYCLIQK